MVNIISACYFESGKQSFNAGISPKFSHGGTEVRKTRRKKDRIANKPCLPCRRERFLYGLKGWNVCRV